MNDKDKSSPENTKNFLKNSFQMPTMKKQFYYIILVLFIVSCATKNPHKATEKEYNAQIKNLKETISEKEAPLDKVFAASKQCKSAKMVRLSFKLYLVFKK